MAQYGDPSNLIRPPFRRHQPEGNPSQPEANRQPQSPQPTNGGNGAGYATGQPRLQGPTPNPWVARRKNQWRQHQPTPNSAPTPPPAALTPPNQGPPNGPTPPPVNRPKSTALHLPTAAQPPQRSAPPPSAERPRPQPPTGTAATPRRPGPANGSANIQRPAVRRSSVDALKGKVTPLRRPSRPPARDAADASAPRRKTRQPPIPVLYIIRLLILGVGVAAIAGTLLSVLSSSNLSSAPAESQTAQESSEPSRSFASRSRGGTINSVPLTQELTRLTTELNKLSTLTPGLTQSSFAIDLETGYYAAVAADQPVAAASTIKVPVLVAFLQDVDAGMIGLEQAVVLQEQDIVGGSGNFQAEAPGTRYTALEVATEMIINSDNTATNMLIGVLGGPEALNQRFQSWGLQATVIRNPLPDLEGTNTTSPRDLALLMALVDKGDLLSLRSRDRLFAIMQRTHNRRLIPSGIGDGAIIANKTGDIASVLGDVALVDAPNGKRYALATLIQRPTNDGRASELIRRIAEQVHKEFNQPIAPVGPGPTPPTSEGMPTEPPAMDTPAGTPPADSRFTAPQDDSGSRVPQG